MTLSAGEVELLLNAAHEAAAKAPEAARLRALRLACLLELLYATGLRVSELVGLPIAALKGDRLMLTVKGKGCRQRTSLEREGARSPGPLYRGGGRDEQFFGLVLQLVERRELAHSGNQWSRSGQTRMGCRSPRSSRNLASATMVISL